MKGQNMEISSRKAAIIFRKLAGKTQDDTKYLDLLEKAKFLEKINKRMVMIRKDQPSPDNSTAFYETENSIWYIL